MTTTQTQPKHKDKVGIIFVANSTNEEMVLMTQNAIITARQYAQGYDLDILVAESTDYAQYAGAEVFNHNIRPFNYNKVLNEAKKKLKADFILFCNNDLLFTENWLDHLLDNKGLCLSPKEPTDGRQAHIKEDTSGYSVATHFNGWCFGLRKEALEKIGDFNEDYQFWFSDNVVVDRFKELGIEPTLVVKSVVKHLGSKTLANLGKEEKYNFTYKEVDRYETVSGQQTEISMKVIGRTKEGRILANKMLPKI